MNTDPVDINCDLGEGLNNEEVIMPLIDSCNIACGGHAGDLPTMLRVIALARQHKVAIGAHPSYPDREHFGRRSLDIDTTDLTAALQQQMEAFENVLTKANGALHHIKAHGALYNDLAVNPKLALSYLEALRSYKNKAVFYVPFDSEIGRLAKSLGYRVAVEAFGDRNYTDELRLVNRKESNALITDKEQVLEHIARIRQGRVRTVGGKELPLKADTICVHSDTDNAVEILKYLKKHLN
ncbi:5-oxoprolinase subunit PxpA [Robertkochia flava]|uniref:5-oxoprolinase subunit PxpA n=1 Tax=Robertkochia flava TaxID=3447986 RepID=UPI001CCC30DD|nr:5-oxoprolinase subunit PxpA [Robertkochia marina]